jgi:peptidyl-prolyl cis-trans isomerase C
MSAGLVVQRVLSGAVTEEGLQAAYDARFAGATQELEYNASHILVETKEEADAIVAELAAGADFADIARDKSKDPGSGANGGLLGWFGKGMMVKPFEDAVLAATVGEVTAPVESQFGWHIILVNETRTQALPALDELREELADELRDAAVQEVIAAATAKAQITRTELEGLDPAFLRNEDLLNE